MPDNFLTTAWQMLDKCLRECNSSGEDVLVNAVIILRNWGTIPSDIRSTKKGIGPQFWGMMTALTDISDPELPHSHCYQAKPFSKLRSKFPHWFLLDRFSTKIAYLCSFSTNRGKKKPMPNHAIFRLMRLPTNKRILRVKSYLCTQLKTNLYEASYNTSQMFCFEDALSKTLNEAGRKVKLNMTFLWTK